LDSADITSRWLTTVSGIDSMKVLRQNLKVAAGFKPMSARQMDALRRRVREEAEDDEELSA
jgi:hypothetical protein